MVAIKCYRYRLNPTSEQEAVFVRFGGARRFVWNWALARRKEHYKAAGRTLSYNAQAKELSDLKSHPETAWLCWMDSQALQQVLMDLNRAFVHFFEKRAKYPRWKSKKRTPNAFRIPQRVSLSVDGSLVYIPKVGQVSILLHRPLEGTVKSATIKQSATGKWHLTFVCQIEMLDPIPFVPQEPVGIDTGLIDFAVQDNGKKTQAPKFYRKQEQRLKRLNRQVSRKKRDSRNRGKARRRLARGYEKVRNQRQAFLHQLTAELVALYDCVCIEDLNVRGLARTKLSKSFYDAAIGAFVRMLEYKCLFAGILLLKVDRFFASTKRCHHCGHLNEDLDLSDRIWQCPNPDCRMMLDRDINAAINILEEGMRLLAVYRWSGGTLNACRDDVRPSTEGGCRNPGPSGQKQEALCASTRSQRL